MGCCPSTIEDIYLSFELYLYQMDPSDIENEFIIKEITKVSIDKEIGSQFFRILAENTNDNIRQFLENKKGLSSAVYNLYSHRGRCTKTFKQMENYSPSENPELKMVYIIDISKALSPKITKKIIKKSMKGLPKDFNIRTISVVKVLEELERAYNPNLTEDEFEMTKTDINEYEENQEEIIRDDEMIIETLNNKILHLIKGYLFNTGPNNNNNQHANNNDNQQQGNNPIIIHHETNTQGNGNYQEVHQQTEENRLDNEPIQYTKIHKIIMRRNKFPTLEPFRNLMKALSKYNSLKKFSFYNNITGDVFEGWSYIADFLSENQAVRALDFHSSTLPDEELYYILKGLQMKRIRDLNLSENFLTTDGALSIGKWLKTNVTLQKLDLSRNTVCNFKADGVKYIVDSLKKHPNIQSVNFSDMELTQSGIYFKELLENSKTLQSLNIRNIKLNFKDFKAICEGLLISTTIRKLNIGMNNLSGDQSLVELSKVVNQSKTLTSLNIDQLNINMDNNEALFTAIENNHTIIDYSISYNPDLKPKVVLNLFFKKDYLKRLIYIPWNPQQAKTKAFTLDEKKFIEKFVTSKPKVIVITQLNN